MGEMALKKREVIERLTKEGIIGLNKRLALANGSAKNRGHLFSYCRWLW